MLSSMLCCVFRKCSNFKTMKKAFLTLLLGGTLAFAACASSRNADPETPSVESALAGVAAFASAAEADAEAAGIAENREIGIIIHVDPLARTLVAQLNAGESIRPGTQLAVRRLDLTPTGLVLVETADRRMVGARVLCGHVAEGQLLVVPNAALKARVSALPAARP